MTLERNTMGALGTQKRVKLVPPDGGWGWMVLAGTAISNIFNQSMLSIFSLLYGDALEAMGHNTQGAALVLSTMLFVLNFGGPIAGAAIKLTSARMVSVVGACCCSMGLFFSGFATNIFHLVLTYGILLGLGLGFIQNSSFVAINSYFKLRKSRAVGLANAGTGVGQTVMPHLVRFLLEHYGYRGTCLVLSALSLHGIAGTLLIQPVEWHMKKVEEEIHLDEKSQLLQEKHKDIVMRKNSYANGDSYKSNRRATEPTVIGQENPQDQVVNKSFSHKELNGSGKIVKHENGVNSNNNNIIEESPKKSLLKKLYDLFDISLLSSPRFINILLGTALSVTSIQNFSMLFPFFLQKVAMMDKGQTAICMSAVAGADICGRLTLPILQDKYKIKARWMLIMTSIWLILIRQILAYQTELYTLIALSMLYGYGRSMIIVARNLAISENCTLDQVPAAVGLGMLTMGIIVPPAGYFLGWIRDYTGSYTICITAQNFLMVILLVTWIPDMLYLHMRDKREKKNENQGLHMS